MNCMKPRHFLFVWIFIFLISGINSVLAQAPDGKVRIIMIGAHPDDCDVSSGGTAAIFAKMGYAVKFLSVLSKPRIEK